MYFNGTGERIFVSDSPQLNPTEFSVVGWIYPVLPHGSDTTNSVFEKVYFATPPNGRGFFLRFWGTNGLILQFGVYTDDAGNRVEYTLTQDWHNFGAIFNGDALMLYVDKELRDSTAVTGTYQVPTGRPLRLGTTGRYHGYIGEIMYLSKAISHEEYIRICELTSPYGTR